MALAQPLLEVRGVETYYGNIRALNGVDIAVVGARPSFATSHPSSSCGGAFMKAGSPMPPCLSDDGLIVLAAGS